MKYEVKKQSWQEQDGRYKSEKLYTNHSWHVFDENGNKSHCFTTRKAANVAMRQIDNDRAKLSDLFYDNGVFWK